jgi:hypothetical protein
MRIGTKMTVTRDKKPVERTEHEAGEHVVVDARGDSIKDLVAVAVRLVPRQRPSNGRTVLTPELSER